MRYHTPSEHCAEWCGRVHINAGGGLRFAVTRAVNCNGDGILKHDRAKKGIPYQGLCGIIGIALVRKQVINLVRCFA